jgi:hypothetical protein
MRCSTESGKQPGVGVPASATGAPPESIPSLVFARDSSLFLAELEFGGGARSGFASTFQSQT